MTTTTDRPEGDTMQDATQDTSSTTVGRHRRGPRLDVAALRQRAQDARAATVLARSRRTQRAAAVAL